MANLLARLLQAIPPLQIASSERSNPEKCHLLALPAELRNLIWYFTLAEAYPLQILVKDIPKVLNTCKQMREEMTLMFNAQRRPRPRHCAILPPDLKRKDGKM